MNIDTSALPAYTSKEFFRVVISVIPAALSKIFALVPEVYECTSSKCQSYDIYGLRRSGCEFPDLL